jgi:hypothetical protein
MGQEIGSASLDLVRELSVLEDLDFWVLVSHGFLIIGGFNFNFYMRYSC